MDVEPWDKLIEEMGVHLGSHSIALTDPDLKLGPLLYLDTEKEVFVGQNADDANAFLMRKYRTPFFVPEIMSLTRQRMRVGGPFKIK